MSFFKKRFFIFLVCLLLASLFFFVGVTTLQAKNKTAAVVRVKESIVKGNPVTAEQLETLEVGAYNLPEGAAHNTEEVAGKLALVDLMPGSYLLPGMVGDRLPGSDARLLQLDGSRVAISIAIKNFSNGLSDKLVSGDIVSCVVTTEESTEIPAALTYVEVLAVTTASGIDKENPNDMMEENLATATLLATPEQAALLAACDTAATVHLALVYRGVPEKAESFLQKQELALQSLESMEIPAMGSGVSGKIETEESNDGEADSGNR